jgi:hypothetical protein
MMVCGDDDLQPQRPPPDQKFLIHYLESARLREFVRSGPLVKDPMFRPVLKLA